MYGMVNRALEDFVRQQYGDEAWARICEAAGVDVGMFVGNQPYDDAVTYDLVGATSRLMAVPAEQVLDGFGRHWVLRTAREGYGDLMDAGGSTLSEFLHNLPNFHARVHLYFDNLEPPMFGVSDVDERSIRLTYASRRPGLGPFVKGLLMGLSEMFKTPIEVVQEVFRGQGAEHDVFLVRW